MRLTEEEVARRAATTPERVRELVELGILVRGPDLLSYLDWFPDPPPRSERTHAELCNELGIPFQLLDRLYAGFGLARPKPRSCSRPASARTRSSARPGSGEKDCAGWLTTRCTRFTS